MATKQPKTTTTETTIKAVSAFGAQLVPLPMSLDRGSDVDYQPQGDVKQIIVKIYQAGDRRTAQTKGSTAVWIPFQIFNQGETPNHARDAIVCHVAAALGVKIHKGLSAANGLQVGADKPDATKRVQQADAPVTIAPGATGRMVNGEFITG